jgi:hypothetical protein
MIGEYVLGLLAPWRRVGRAEFSLAVGVLSLPGLIMMLMGTLAAGATWLGPLQPLLSTSTPDAAALERLLQQLQTSQLMLNHEAAIGLDIPAFFSAMCLLLATPFCRGRLLEMGYSPRVAVVMSLLMQLSVLNSAIAAVAGAGPLPYAAAFGLLTLVGYTWLAIRPGKPRTHRARGPANVAARQRLVDDDDFPRI